MRRSSRKTSRWVVKAGSNMVCSGGPLLARAWMQQIARLARDNAIEVVWVTSGAIASAAERTRFPNARKRTLTEKQALSAIGQPLVMDTYNLALQATGLLGAQVLLTADDLRSQERRRNFVNTIDQLLSWKVTPILNENDAVSTEEIKFGDNDSLSAKVAGQIGAQRLVILTDVEGLYDADPRSNPAARLVHDVDRVTTRLLEQTGRAPGSTRGTGGMYSKLRAAQEAAAFGIETWLVQGDRPNVLIAVASGERVGTRIGKRVR